MTGARHPLGGPTGDLLLAYRGTAYFLRWLNRLSEQDYDEPGDPRSSRSRRRTIATVGYDARGLAQLFEAAREGRPDPGTFAPGEREESIELGTSLPPRALRHLVEHSAVHLRVEWRDLPAPRWADRGRDHLGHELRLDQTPRWRAQQVWTASVDLGNGARAADFPAELAEPARTAEPADLARGK